MGRSRATKSTTTPGSTSTNTLENVPVELNWPAVVSLLALVLAACASALLWWLVRYVKRLEKRWDPTIESLSKDLHALCIATSRAGDRLIDVEYQSRRLALRQEQFEMKGSQSEDLTQAIALVKRGAGTDELIAACGMGHGEAELLHLLHRS